MAPNPTSTLRVLDALRIDFMVSVPICPKTGERLPQQEARRGKNAEKTAETACVRDARPARRELRSRLKLSSDGLHSSFAQIERLELLSMSDKPFFGGSHRGHRGQCAW